MQVKTTQKLSRSAVATVLATSTVALGLPAEQTNAAQYFKDVKTTDFFYSAVNELADKKIVNGYGDGTFRPYNNVTRGEAAKMLALALKLDVANAETTQFKDVKKGDIFYKYIAALANKGIINGYPDGSFKPNEVVQRGAMAKMVALGYGFTLATNITHSFKDVDQKHIFNQHIQTLVNLNITKGTSFNTFAPGKAVTRGELATFISRSNKADAGKPIYVVDNLIGNKIYINSVGYTIGANVASYLKVENKSALIGAHIEGTFNGMTLTNVTKLTLNATGNNNSIYSFDGGYSTYNGTLVVNGSYLKFKNWTLNGQTIVSETPRKSLAKYNRISELKIASLASGIIDFTKPTNPDDGNLNNGDNGNLKPGKGTSPNAPYSEKLSPIYKYVDFTNVTVRNLLVEQNRAYVVAQKEIPLVTIRRDVEFAELNFNMRNLYVEGDKGLTLYGTHDIATVYKNSYYSVFFNSSSHINTLIADNSNGWINLGDYVRIDKVIIPPKTTPNDIFDDYKNDNDKIGNIEDNTGGEVDRDPIENGIVPDLTPPDVPNLTVVADSNEVTASLTVDETGKYYYLILPKNDPAPTVREIVSSASAFSGSGTVTDSDKKTDGRYTTSFIVSGLESITKYTMYVVHVDDAGNFSPKANEDFETKDGTPPTFEQAKATAMPGGRRIQFDFKPSETGKYYYFVREAQNVDNTITVDDVITGAQDFGAVTPQMVTDGHKMVIREDENGNRIKPLTKYVVYSVLVDDSGNKIIQANMFKSTVTTSALDETPPFVFGENENKKQQLIRANTNSLNEFYLYFSEKVDKKLAEDEKNYLLSGTGIVNVPGQAPITPTKVVYEEARNRVLITIPSLTGFVNGDTLRVTVLPAVKDLAENDFENYNNAPVNETPRNYAEYHHIDRDLPNLLNVNITKNLGSTLAEINFEATKAGTVYYMILPSGTDLVAKGIEAKDFVAEFNPQTETNKFYVSGTTNKIYLEGKGNLKPGRTAELGVQRFNYDLDGLQSNPFISYDLYMVLKDRSGNLSPIVNKTLIEDKKAPVISGFEVAAKKVDPTRPDDTQAEIKVQSDERGTVLYRLVKKYVVDRPASGSTQATYKLNPLVHNSSGQVITSIPGTEDYVGNTNAMKEQAFRRYFTGADVTGDIPMNQGLTSIPITNLSKHEEYVAVVAVKDTFGNFTVLNDQSVLMMEDFYTDHTVPKIIDNLVYRNLDNTYTISFSETIMRDYDSTLTGSTRPSITQKSKLLDLNLNDIVTITMGDSSGTNTVGTDITNQFRIESYEVGPTIDNISKLKIVPINPSQYSAQTIEVRMKPGIVDQKINDNKSNAFDLRDFGRYIHRNLAGDFLQILHLPNTDQKRVRAVFDLTSTSLQFAPNERIKYYYTVKSARTNQSDIDAYTMQQVIADSIAANNINGNNGNSGTLEAGDGVVPVLQSRAEITLNHTVGFVLSDFVIVVLEDRYGNRILRVNRVGYQYQPPTTP